MFPEPVRALINEFEIETGTVLLDLTPTFGGIVSYHRNDVRRLVVATDRVSHDGMNYDDLKRTLAFRLRQLNWQFCEVDDKSNVIDIAPMAFSNPPVAFHTTRTSNLDSIFIHGLLPSTAESSNSQRADCRGNIYVCPTLGTEVANAESEPKKETAHWWRWHFAQNNRFNDAEWCIIEVCLTELDVKVYRDIWSASGLIVDGIDKIPPEYLSVVWPERNRAS